MRKHWRVTSFDWQLAALEDQRRAEMRAQYRRQRLIEAARVSIVAAALCVPVAVIVWLAQLPWWAFAVVALMIWIGAFVEWSK